MSTNDVITYLKQYQYLKLRLQFLKSSVYGVKAIRYDSIHMSGGESRTLTDKLSDIDDIEDMMQEIQIVINSPNQLLYRIILTYVYIDGLTLQAIANKNLMGYSYRQLRRIHHDAISCVINHSKPEILAIIDRGM